MANFPFMPLYVGDYLADTRGLSAIEHGAYLLLIMEYWQSSGLPDDDDRLARIASVSDKEWRSIRSTLARFFEHGWKHKRVEQEIARREVKSEKARNSASRRWKDRPPEPPMPTHSERNANAMRTHEKRIENASKNDAKPMLSQSQPNPESLAVLETVQPSSREIGLVDSVGIDTRANVYNFGGGRR